jgi:hypothetical protein
MKGKFFVSAFKRRWVMALCAVLFVALAAGIPLLVTAQQAPPPPRVPPPDVVLPKPPPVLDRETIERGIDFAHRCERREFELAPGFTIACLHGPATRGMTIEVRGVSLTLPADAELSGLIMEALLPAGTTSPLPFPIYHIVRRGQDAGVSKVTGQYQIKGCLEDFQFLVDKLGADKLVGPAHRCR